MTYRSFRGACDDIGLLMATVFLFLLVILALGAPLAFCVRVVIDMLRRL